MKKEKKEEKRTVLNRETLQKALKKSVKKEIDFDLAASLFIGMLCMIIWGFFHLNDGDTEVPVLIFFVMIPIIAFGILRIGAMIKRRKTKNTPYILLHTKIADRTSISSPDPESTSESYYFIFNCADHGPLLYEVDSNRYQAAYVGKDAYYLVVVKKRFSKNHKIAAIFSTEEYELSSELEKLVRVV